MGNISNSRATASRRHINNLSRRDSSQLDRVLIACLPILRWLPAGLVVWLAAHLRLWNVGSSYTSLIFDEIYYVPQATALIAYGHEIEYGQLLGGVNIETGERVEGVSRGAFNPDALNLLDTSLSYNVHPPLGKWLIAGGMNLFGSDNPFGWRFASAVFGTLLVALTIVLGWQLLNSAAWATFAGALVAIDGVAVTMSRVAMLDIFLATFVLAGVCAVVADFKRERRRLDSLIKLDSRLHLNQVTTFNRPWLIAAAVMFSAASAVKISGLIFFAVFAIYVFVGDWLHRRSLTPKVRLLFTARQILRTLLITIPVATATWTLSWLGLFNSGKLTSPFGWIGDYIAAYDQEASSTGGQAGPFASHAWGWLVPLKPVVMMSSSNRNQPDHVSDPQWVNQLMTVGNPALWWTGAVALIAIIVAAVWKGQHAAVVIALGVSAGWVPWLLVLDRPIYQFYTIAFVAFIALALVYVGQVATKAEGRTKMMRVATRGLVVLFLIAAAALAWKFAPINYGIKMTPEQAIELRWLETWDREPDRGEPMGNTEIFLQ